MYIHPYYSTFPLLLHLAGFLLYFTYGIENSSENTFHDKVSLHTFTPLPSTDIDDCFDDSETEITLFMEEMKNNG